MYLIERNLILIILAFNLTDYLVQKSCQMNLQLSCGKLSATSDVCQCFMRTLGSQET